MTTRRAGVLPTVVVLFVAATAGLIYLNSRDDDPGSRANGSRGDEVISLFVDFGDSPRQVGVHVMSHVGERQMLNDVVHTAPNVWVVTVPRGEQVVLTAIQSVGGELQCKIFSGDVRHTATRSQIGPTGRRFDAGAVRCYHNRV